jgi:signal transduction histidine kinase
MTSITGSMSQIEAAWIAEAEQRLASHEAIQRAILDSLIRFYDLMITAVECGSPDMIEPILDEWVRSSSRIELDKHTSNVTLILNQVLSITVEIASENLENGDALALIETLLPLFTHSYLYVAQRETQIQISDMSAELEDAREALEQLDKSKSDFISIAAHELKTPLTLIEGYTAMVREQISKEKESQIEILLQGIDHGTRRLHEIVDDMIDVSLIDNNLLKITFQPVWINRLLELVHQEFSQTIDTRMLRFEIKPFAGSNELTFGDGERLYQALCNIVSNSIKYTPDKGQIIIDGRILPGFIEITVADTGIGIDPDDQTRIFDKFGRVGSVTLHSSGKTKFKGGGPGLGLPIARGIIEAHGGAIWVESDGFDEERCPGTTFHVLLPIRKEPPEDKLANLFRMVDKTQKEQRA